MNHHIKLTCKNVTYYCRLDEHSFFEWIKKIPSIIKFDGQLDELYLYFHSNRMPADDLRQLIGLFVRYKIDMKQLKIFSNKSNEAWFKNGPWANKIWKN